MYRTNPQSGILKIVIICMLVVSLLPFNVGIVQPALNNWEIEGDIVFSEDENAYLSATPHTIADSGWVEFYVKPKTYTGNVDICWGFSTPTVTPTKAEYYAPHWDNETTYHSYTFINVSDFKIASKNCELGNLYNSYHYNITHQIQTDINESSNKTIYGNISTIACFDSYSQTGEDYTIYWATNHPLWTDWVDVSGTFESANYNYGGMNKWFYIKNFTVTEGNTYKIRAWLEIPVTTEGVNGKYFWAIKPSSHTIQEAILSGDFYALDPWYNAAWTKKKAIHIDNTGAGLLTYYQVGGGSNDPFNITYAADMNANFSDLRVVNDTSGALVPFWNESGVNGAYCNIWFNASSIAATSWTNTTYYLYYGNPEAASVSEINTTFTFGDEFTGNAVNPAKWIPTGTPTVANGILTLNAGGEKTISKATYQYKIMRVRANYDAGLFLHWTGFVDYTGDSYNFSITMNDGGGNRYLSTRGQGQGQHDEAMTAFGGAYHVLEVVRIDSTKVEAYLDNTIDATSIVSIPIKSLPVGLRMYSAGGTMLVDWVLVREYVAVEPTAILGGEESSFYTPGDPTNLQNTTGEYWVNYTWDAGAGNGSDSFNISWNGSWTNGSTNTYMNQTVPAGGWANITVWAFNSTNIGSLSGGSVSDQVQVSTANAPNITSWSNNVTSDISITFSVWENNTSCVSFNATANQSITWTWWLDGVNQSNDWDNITICFDTYGTYNISVNGSNENGNTQTITWTVTYTSYLYELYISLSEEYDSLAREDEMLADMWLFLVMMAFASGLMIYSWLGLGRYFYTDVVAGALSFTIFYALAFYSITTLELAWLAIITIMFGLVQTLYVGIKIFCILKTEVEDT